MKRPIVLLLLILPTCLLGQSVFTNHTHTALQKVIGDYPHKFKNIKGGLITNDFQSEDYDSKVQIPGTSQAIVTRYSSSDEQDVYSWKCVAAVSEDFEEIAKKYKEIYNQIKNSIVKIEGEKPLILSGTYEAPTEEKRFVSSTFQLLPPGNSLGRVKVELALEFFVVEWKISLLVFDQDEEAFVME